MIVGTFQPSQRNNHTKTVYYGFRYGSFGYYITHVGRICPVQSDELRSWTRHYTEDDFTAGVSGHFDARDRQGELF